MLTASSVMQLALTVGTVLFGLYVASRIWSKQDGPGEPCSLLIRGLTLPAHFQILPCSVTIDMKYRSQWSCQPDIT